MGTGFSYFTRKSSSLRIESVESDPFEVMAEGKPRDAAWHTSEARISQDDFKRYTAAFQVVQEFFKNSASMMDRQRSLESELETCQERYDLRLTEYQVVVGKAKRHLGSIKLASQL